MNNKSRLSLIKILPSILTVSSTLLGLLAINQAINGNVVGAIYLILMSSLLDALDGRVARMLKAVSDFGGELDSFSDFTTFGIAPAFIMYYGMLYDFHPIGWISVCIFAVASMLRLARFNTINLAKDSVANGNDSYFMGIPAPAGALLLLMPFYLSIGFNITINSFWVCTYCLVISFLMVSTIPTLSLKKLRFNKKFLPLMAVLITSLVLFLIYYTWVVLFVSSIFYLASVIITGVYFALIKK